MTKENLIAQIDRLRKIKDEQGQLSMSGEYTLQAYEMLLATIEAEPVAEITEDLGRLFVKIHCPTTLKAGDKLYCHAQPATAVPDGLIKAVEFYEQVKRENPPVETGAWKDAVDWVLTEACRAAMLNRK